MSVLTDLDIVSLVWKGLQRDDQLAQLLEDPTRFAFRLVELSPRTFAGAAPLEEYYRRKRHILMLWIVALGELVSAGSASDTTLGRSVTESR